MIISSNNTTQRRVTNVLIHHFCLEKFHFFLTVPSFLSLHTPDNDLYVGTEADFSGNDPIIYREPLQTDQYDSLSLNGKLIRSSVRCGVEVKSRLIITCLFLSQLSIAPNFVGSFAFGDFVYFFFREAAIEYTNCGKVGYLTRKREEKRMLYSW